jgi:hypothetical protein
MVGTVTAPVGPHCPSCWALGETPEHRPGCPVLRAIFYAVAGRDGVITTYPSRRSCEAALRPGDRVVRRIGLRKTWRTFDGTEVVPVDTV